VLITAGSQEALYLSLMTLVNEGDEVLLPDPGFVAYPAIVRMAGGIPVYYRLPAASGFGFDAADFSSKLTPRTKVVVIISPSNPTGRALSPADLAAMAEALHGHTAFVISDEIYRDLYFGRERPGTISDLHQRTLVIGGLSKSLSMTGWRLGWLCGPEEVVSAARLLHGYVVTCASTVSQKAALAAWSDAAQAAQAGMRNTLRLRRDALLQSISEVLQLRCVVPDGAFYCMMEVRRYGPCWQVAEAILKGGVITVPGTAFGPEGEGFLRLSFSADVPILHEAVARMHTVLAGLPVSC
jgi:aminotransferase